MGDTIGEKNAEIVACQIIRVSNQNLITFPSDIPEVEVITRRDGHINALNETYCETCHSTG
jgi:hypothetical protein